VSGSSARPRARSFVDYSLQRRAALVALQRGSMSKRDVCDADPYLLRAAHFHGEPIGRRCPICRARQLSLLRYVFSDELGKLSGRLKTASEVVELSNQYGAIAVYVVEVCRRCSWNHLLASYVIGDGVVRGRGRAGATSVGEPDRYGD
jgi:hypothetical protein